jgi:hypothetical protein
LNNHLWARIPANDHLVEWEKGGGSRICFQCLYCLVYVGVHVPHRKDWPNQRRFDTIPRLGDMAYFTTTEAIHPLAECDDELVALIMES